VAIVKLHGTAPDGAGAGRARDPVDPRRAGLRRMRTVATLLLVAMTLIFVATSLAKVDWPWLPYVRAFAEAGMVGACADWFAVVALFRRPLGLPIPHTGIVPSNKERIGAALGRFMTNNFLTGRTMRERFDRLDVIGALAAWMSDPDNGRRLARYVASMLPRIVETLPGPELAAFLGALASRGIAAVPAAPLAARLLAIVWAHGEAQALIARGVDYGERALRANKDAILRKVSDQSGRWIPKWIDRMIAERVASGLIGTMAEMRDPAHPWRVELHDAVERLIHELATDPQLYAQGEAFKAELLASPAFIAQARTLWAEVEGGVRSGVQAHADAIAQACEAALRNTGAWLVEEPGRKAQLNRRIRITARRLIRAYRVDIGAYIERVVRNWDNTTLVERLELQVGKDLQYIRINGTLVGGLVGLLIFVVSKWLAAL
jgi:uncharacterized membrane-anchored protein YjiN (DUF445 family)